jgi:hypothetical protein
MWKRSLYPSVMSEAHPTTTPEQLETDTFAVFRDFPANQNLELIDRVQVPRHDQPNESGGEMRVQTRKQLAVMLAVENERTFIESFNNPHSEVENYQDIAGEEFMVMHDVEAHMQHVPYNPTEQLRNIVEAHDL